MLTGEMHGHLSLSQHSDDCSLPHLILADISHQSTCTIILILLIFRVLFGIRQAFAPLLCFSLMVRKTRRSLSLMVRKTRRSLSLMVRKTRRSLSLMVRKTRRSLSLMVRKTRRSLSLMVRKKHGAYSA